MIKKYEKPRKKKHFGQHFLRKHSVVNNMIKRVFVDSETSVMEIGCGDGFLSRAIIDQTKCKKFLIYEIDPEWSEYVSTRIDDDRLDVQNTNFLDVDLSVLGVDKPWVLLANLPYQVTFPIMFRLQRHRKLFREGVVMVQEEVAQKIVATSGRSYGVTSILLQHYFDFELMEKVEPGAFIPPPKVFSRLLYFKPKETLVTIENEEKFWKFARICFASPRQMIRNNLKSSSYDLEKIPKEIRSLRAQQISFEELLELWKHLDLKSP
jgi:16S rRNA (adenine1518-N6/adenine1519-N6)-dimethyltransferase